MKLKLLAAAALAAGMISGPVLAQTAPENPETQELRTDFTSDDERMLYEENMAVMTPFFTDETFGTLRTDEEVAEAFSAMGAEDQAAMRSACERANENPGSYGPVTAGLCAQIGEL